MEKLLSIKDVSAMLGISANTINGWIFKKTMPIPYYHINGRSIRFKEEDIKAYIDSVKVEKDI
ncbi:MAG: helix-turn-helix domain-containing protein [Alphaproteobacteria bacterium]|nr:helix-turn-helix domain-containing protein [Alphaproteobacteria bacterium]